MSPRREVLESGAFMAGRITRFTKLPENENISFSQRRREIADDDGSSGPSLITEATGGNIVDVGPFRQHRFTADGADTFEVISMTGTEDAIVTYVVQGGGGRGGDVDSDVSVAPDSLLSRGGGGGGGGFRQGSYSVNVESYPISVGRGGNSVIPAEESFFDLIHCGGGGRGGDGDTSGFGPGTDGDPGSDGLGGGSGGGGSEATLFSPGNPNTLLTSSVGGSGVDGGHDGAAGGIDSGQDSGGGGGGSFTDGGIGSRGNPGLGTTESVLQGNFNPFGPGGEGFQLIAPAANSGGGGYGGQAGSSAGGPVFVEPPGDGASGYVIVQYLRP